MIRHGDCLEVLKELPDNFIDSLVTDPPAGISFMGKQWDKSDGFIPAMTEAFKECLRVMKPGAHGLVWAIPRTSHWTATALEDAGFEIRDVVTHLFGSGFPKSLNIEKAGAGDKWSGWGTALKPASEHWILVRKPLSEKTVAANVLKWGCGGLNIDASRIATTEDTSRITNAGMRGNNFSGGLTEKGPIGGGHSQGRFPANLVLSHNEDCVEVGTKKVKPHNGGGYRPDHSKQNSDTSMFGISGGNNSTYVSPDGTETVAAWECTEGCPIKLLDEQSGKVRSSGSASHTDRKWTKSDGTILGFGQASTFYNDSGGASRFFYCAKASKRERNEGCEVNGHPTVKPIRLMQYLITMVTPPGGTVLDPFMGSGSTCVAAKKSGFMFIGIEKEKEYIDIAEKRIQS